ncbi:uncharacterized protein LOC128208024 [Mya arenaria]|uniref:uncharacterized protein LOC128208024 n=1 Tax=Mya arenaria TaxID=6604 RepID=UPI0022E35FBE|nr:uncharacterized protein LOC128208024 [Mya arenaria]
MAPGPVEELALLELERSNKGASKQRRDQINGEIGTMRDLLPLPESARQRLSQLQIMSLSCVYIRKCNILQKMLPSNRCSIEVPCDFSSALTGFILVTTRDGKLVYISENVTEYLGHSMVDMKTQGDSLFDIVDKRDHGTVQAQLLHGSTSAEGSQDRQISFFCRMNMSRTLKRQGGFGDVKVMHVRGHLVPVGGKETSPEQHMFMALCTPLITPDVKESLIQNNTTVFKSVHKLDMSFIEITETGEFHLGLGTTEVEGRSWYSMLHPEDLAEARAKHMQLIKSRHEMGCMMTVRMLTETHETVWVNIVMHVRQALVTNSDDPVIVCINQVVSENEAAQFKSQGQLFALFAARTPDMFFGGHHFNQLQQEMLTRQHAQAYMQQQPAQPQGPPGFFAEQQRYQYTAPSQTQTSFPQQQSQYMGGIDSICQQQRTQGHTSTIRALKRKLQENFISSCKPSKMSRVGSFDSEDGGFADFISGGETQYVMNVNVFRSAGSASQAVDNGGIAAFTGETMPLVYQHNSLDPMHALRLKKSMRLPVSMNPVAFGAAPIVQKLPPTCTLEQVVPEVVIPDCYLTPDPSPASSPKPLISRTGIKQETQEIKQLTSYVMGRLDELKQNQTISEPSVKLDGKKRKNLPIIDATFVDTFFDEIEPMLVRPGSVEIKTEPMSPPVPMVRESHLSPPVTQTSHTPSPPPTVLPMPPTCELKEELTLEDCTYLEEFLGLVGSAGPEIQAAFSPVSVADSMSPVASPTSVGTGCMPESLSPRAPTYGSNHCIKQQSSMDQTYPELSPCSTSPGYEGRDDLMDPDNWLLEPISLPLEMTLDGLDTLPEMRQDVRQDELCRLKQILQQTWGPCGSFSHKTTL